jgi:sigma-B regulation protein RsbU (phosphoserine phosphatase)
VTHPGANPQVPQKRIALLVDSFDAAYQAALVHFARRACARRGLGLVVFPGGVIAGKSFAAEQRNHIYELISAARFDGVIILSGTMTREVRPSVVGDFCRRYLPLPMCSIGSRLDGMPSYLIDNAGGTRSLVRHLVQDHGYRRLAFIAGPPTSEEADERLAAFRDELALLGVALGPNDVVRGDLMPASGHAALDLLLARNASPPEAIMAANDAMAMGALDALTRHPVELATTIAVCGFDNVVETDFCSPPLTTVEQPLARLADAAVDGLVAQIAGRPYPEVSRFEARPVLRRSCGCDATRAAAPEMQRRKASRRGNSVLEFMRHREEIVAELALAAGDVYDAVPRWREHLVDSFMNQVRGAAAADFLSLVAELLRHTMLHRQGETWRFHNVLSAMRVHCLPCVAGEASEWARAEDLLQTARTLTGEAVLRGQAKRLLNADQQHLSTNQLGTQLAEARDEQDFDQALLAAARELGIGRLIVLEFLGSHGVTPAPARVFWFGEPGRQRPALPRAAFPCTRLVPVDEWLDGGIRDWVALPLFYRGHSLGYVLAELCLYDGKAYESVRVHLSVALWALRGAGKSARSSAAPAG